MALMLTGCGLHFRGHGRTSERALPTIRWNEVGASKWDDFQTHLQAGIDAGVSAPVSFSTISISGGAHKSDGFVLAANGVMYAPPYGDATGAILKFDPKTGVTSRFGALGAASYPGAVLGLNGKIYAVPERNSSDILEIDPATDAIRLIPTPAVTTPCGGNAKWAGTVVAPNGKIYGIPACADHIVEYDPITDVAQLIGEDYSGCSYCWTRATLAPNGKIYGMPNVELDGRAVVVDPTTGTSSRLTGFGSVVRKCGTALSLDGSIWGFPCNGMVMDILRIDSDTDTVTRPVTTADAHQIWSGVPGPNGKIYAHDGRNGGGDIVEFDPATQSIVKYDGVFPAGAYSEGGQVGFDGKIYYSPLNSDQISVIEIHPNLIPDKNVVLSPYFNGSH